MRLKSLGLTNFMVGAMDDELYRYMTEMGVATWHMGSKGIEKDAVKKDFEVGIASPARWAETRSGSSETSPRWRASRFSSPTSTWRGCVIRRSSSGTPAPTSSSPPISCDRRSRWTHPAGAPSGRPMGLEFHVCHAASNIGMMWFRPTRGSQQLTEEWVRRIEADDKLWDQNAFNDLKALAAVARILPTEPD